MYTYTHKDGSPIDGPDYSDLNYENFCVWVEEQPSSTEDKSGNTRSAWEGTFFAMFVEEQGFDEYDSDALAWFVQSMEAYPFIYEAVNHSLIRTMDELKTVTAVSMMLEGKEEA